MPFILRKNVLSFKSRRVIWSSVCLCITFYIILLVQSSVIRSISRYHKIKTESDSDQINLEYIVDIFHDKGTDKNYSDGLISKQEIKVQPVVLIERKIDGKKFSHYLTVRLQGRLGNMMFAYASLLGIAKQNKMLVCIPEDAYLKRIFSISAANCPGDPFEDWPKFDEYCSSAYDSRSAHLNYGIHIELVGYLQSWKYFHRIENDIKGQFTFDKQTQTISRTFLKKSAHRSYPHINPSEIVFIGVHVRRSDMLEEYNMEKGYTVADAAYLDSAMTFFKAKYHYNKLLFVVCSDSMSWTRANINKELGPLVYSPFNDFVDEAQDLSLLSQCNHTVMTVGTYSWWAAWLADGTTVYYKDYPTPGSDMDYLFEPQDYFYPSWIGM